MPEHAPAGPDGSAGSSPVPVDFQALFAAIPTAYLVMSPDLVIVEANEAYLANVGRTREDLIGRPVFQAFPPTAEALDDDGVPHIKVSLERARDTGRPDTMAIQRYDIPDPAGGGRLERFWSLISVPVLGPDGQTVLVVQRNEDITDFIRERERGQAERTQGQAWQRRVQEVETDLYARAQELAAAVNAQQLASQRLTSLAEVALQLTTAETVEDLAAVVFRAGLPVLNATGGSIAVHTPGSDQLEVTVTDSLGPDTQHEYAQMPLHGPMPTSVAARGSLVLVPDEHAAAAFPGLPEALVITGTQAWAALPLQVGSRLLGSLAVGWAQPQTFDTEQVELLRAFAAQCAQALARLQARLAERAAAAEVARISETLQRSLLTEPPASEHLSIAVRYRPASQVAQVGGDWYDAFLTPDGTTSLVIGDVAGHDKQAAAAMGQVRNILRGIAVTLAGPPSAVLSALDRALHGLQLDVLATLVLCQISQTPEQQHDGTHTLRWCNAGHPPPLLLCASGTAELLAPEPDLLVGLVPGADRADHELVLAPGDTVLLYTDGLVETRGNDLYDDLERLRLRLTGQPGRDPQALLDQLTDPVDDLPDDVALLAVQILPAATAATTASSSVTPRSAPHP